MAKSKSGHIETRPILRLIPHPRQQEIFPSPSPREVEELAADLKRNGQLTPVEILPDGTIIAGHKRVAAARLLEWSEVEVWVRHDLADDPSLATHRLVEDNLNRRQLGALSLARCYKVIKSECQSHRKRLTGKDRRDLRDDIGQRLGCSGRTLDRYLRVLEDTPREVQDAVEHKLLSLTHAEKVAGMPPRQRDRIAAEMRAGGKPSEVVRRHLRHSIAGDRQRTGTIAHVLRAAENLVVAAEAVRTPFSPILSRQGQDILASAKAAIDILLERSAPR
jgi:ParB/RepB/Spo0J family partition protein